MNPQLLEYYNRELQHVREMGGEFAREFPKIAGRLGLDGFECADPYVERLLEGFAFMAARVQLKVDAEFPRFTQHLLEMVYPHYLMPTPSMTVVQLQPDLSEGSLNDGFSIPRGTPLRSQIGKGEQTACEFRTAHEVCLWPMELSHANYLPGPSAVANLDVPSVPGLKAGIHLRLKTTAGLTFNQLTIDKLPIYIRAGGELGAQLYEQLLAHCLGFVVQPVVRPSPWRYRLNESSLQRYGFEENQALMPYTPRSFRGYRLLQEYFAFPERYMFFELRGLQEAFRRCQHAEIDIIILLKQSNPLLADGLDASSFALYSTPAINLFPKRTDRIHLSHRSAEYHVVADRTRPLDLEVCDVTEVKAYGAGNKDEQEFLPFYKSREVQRQSRHLAYFTLQRKPRLLSNKQRRRGPRSSYIGSDAYISLVDGRQAPLNSDMRQLAITAMCSNRDLPLHMPVGIGKTDFTLQTGAPIESIRCLAGPTKPRASVARSETAWRLISHLSLNYLSLIDRDKDQGATAIRELLNLYGENSDASIRKQIDGVLSVSAQPMVGRIDGQGPISFGRGLEIALRVDDSAFEGSGAFLLGSVLDEFFAQYISINSFTETVLVSIGRGEIKRWPARIGRRQIL